MRIDNWEQIVKFIRQNPGTTGAEVAKTFGVAGRTARRYVEHFGAERRSEHSNFPAEDNSAVVFDIETTDFKTDGLIGKLVCCSFLPLHTNEVETLQLEFDDKDDKRLLQLVAKKLSEYRFHIGHNIIMFDYGWLNSRLMYYNLPPLDGALYFDTFQVSKALNLKTSKGLGNLVDYFGLPGEKTTIYRTSWSKVFSKDQEEFEEAMDNIVYHCEQDVISNRNLYNMLFGYALQNGRENPWKVAKFRGVQWANQ
jgi:uncharacterized protein YprB with RNaseH-like and TPR domain